MIHKTNNTRTQPEEPTAVGRLLDISPLGGETIDRGEMPITLKPVFDPDDHEPVAGTLTIGDGIGKRDITITLPELCRLRERLDYLTETIIEARMAAFEKKAKAKEGE